MAAVWRRTQQIFRRAFRASGARCDPSFCCVGLTKEAFIATGVVIACVIDISRIFIYSERFSGQHFEGNYLLLIAAMLTPRLGAYIGSKLLKKITMGVVQAIVSILLILLGLALVPVSSDR
ncbi:MAG: hypothetical protein R3C26_22130 [Calditrichia bacterium]